MHAVKIIHSPNPLNGDGRSIKSIVIDTPFFYDFLRDHGYLKSPCNVAINDQWLDNDTIKTAQIKNNDVVVVKGVAQAEAAAISIINFFAIESAIGIGLAYIAASIALAVAANVVLGAITGSSQRSGGEARGSRKDEDGYSISGGGNAFRKYQPLQLVLGKIRVYPDFGSRWFTDYIQESTSTFVLNNTPHTVIKSYPAFNFGSSAAWNTMTAAQITQPALWSNIFNTVFPANEGDAIIYGDGVSRTYATPNGTVTKANTFLVQWTAPAIGLPWTAGSLMVQTQESFDASEAMQPYVSGGSLPVVDYYGTFNTENTQRITNIYNYGLGDLVLSDHYIGTNPANQNFYNITVQNPIWQNTSVSLPNWIPSDNSAAIEYPSDVEVVEGGLLTKSAGAAGVWVQRQTARDKVTHIEFDISGRLFINGSSGPQTATVEVEMHYRNLAGGAWVTAGIVTLSNGDTTPVRQTYRYATPIDGQYEVRVRINTDDTADSRRVQEIRFEGHRAYNRDNTGYPYQHRVGVTIQATKQLNGALDRWSSIASAKTWVYTGGAVWDGSNAGSGANWAWQETSNPAWWFLYFLLGGFENDSVPVGHPLFNRGWMLGESATNRLRLFGCGRPHVEIDYTSIVKWAAYCVSKDLQFDAVLDSNRQADEVLQDIARIGRASRNQSSGKMGVVYMQASDPTVQMFGMGNIVAGSFSVGYITTKEIDEIVLTYVDRDENYSSRQVRAIVPNTPQPLKDAAINLWGCTRASQAQREVNLVAAEQAFLRRRVSFVTDIEGLQCQRLDVITLGHDLTNWAQTGRVMDFVVVGGRITAVKLDRDLDPISTGSAWIQWRNPHGGFVSAQIASNSTVISAGTAIALITSIGDAHAAGELQQGTNLASNYPNTYPEDFVYHVSPDSNAGRRLRIISVQPQANERVQITCADESPQWYTYEYSPWPNYLPPIPLERLIARAFNVGVLRENNNLRIVWELQNAIGADVSIVSILSTGILTVPSDELLIPLYMAGTVLNITVTPNPISNAVGVESSSFVFIV
jgi:hypothetical protein